MTSGRVKESELKTRRAIYIQQRLIGVRNRRRMIERLSLELFISIDTIYKDLKRVFPNERKEKIA